MSRVPLKARTGFRYGRRMLRPGDRFEAKPHDSEILIELGRAVPVPPPACVPADTATLRVVSPSDLIIVPAVIVNTNIEDVRVTHTLDATVIPPAPMVIDPPPVDEPLTILLVDTGFPDRNVGPLVVDPYLRDEDEL